MIPSPSEFSEQSIYQYDYAIMQPSSGETTLQQPIRWSTYSLPAHIASRSSLRRTALDQDLANSSNTHEVPLSIPQSLDEVPDNIVYILCDLSDKGDQQIGRSSELQTHRSHASHDDLPPLYRK